MRIPVRWPALAVAALLVAACADDDTPSQTPATDEIDGPGGFAAANYTTDLTQVCPDTIVIQGSWLPAAEFGGMYQMIGSAGTVDPDTGSYRGPLGSTGVDVEIRLGGPYVGFQTVESMMFQDDDILLGSTETDRMIQFSQEFPTTAVMTRMERSPRVMMWDPEQFDFDSYDDIGESNATMLVLETDNLAPYLISKGLVPADKFDYSYDGTAARFVTEQGIVQPGTVTFQVYQYEHDLEEWGKPVDYLFWDDSGFDSQSVFAVRRDKLEESAPCLEKLVPVIQQAHVDYFTDPSEVNALLLRIVDELATFWTLSEGLNNNAVEKMLELGVAANGPDDTFGKFDEERVRRFTDDMIPVFAGLGQDTHDPQLSMDDMITNEFVETGIGFEEER